MSWYRQYRPTTVGELHLASVRTALHQMMQAGQLPHALLFTGPKGTGKTSAARIIAAMVNDPQNAEQKAPLQEPSVDDELVQRIYRGSSFVVQELDAASHRGIDDVRQLKERASLPPQEGQVAVYILDEVHMLTTEAFNALLKLLEEPPPHVMFILATTELHKVPATVVSRCTVIQFHKASVAELTQALTQILTAEAIEFEPAAVEQLAIAADGSFRDGVKLLENAARGKATLTTADVVALNIVQTQRVQTFIELLLQKDEVQLVQFFEALRQEGADQTAFTTALCQVLHHQLLIELGIQPGEAFVTSKVAQYLLGQFQHLELSTVMPFLSLELKALELAMKSKEKNGASQQPGSPPSKKKLPSTPEPNVESLPQLTALHTKLESVEVAYPSGAHASPELALGQGEELLKRWEEFIQLVKEKNTSLAAVLRSAKPTDTQLGRFKMEVYYQFHQEQLKQPKFLTILEACGAIISGGKLIFEVELAEQAKPGAALSTVSGQVNEGDHLIQLAKEILV